MKDDTISRKAAIDAIDKLMVSIPTVGGKDLMDDVNRIRAEDISVIKRLPSAQPERKRGKWEIYVISMFDGEGCRCSECGLEGVPYWDFCPNCGADMRGEQDG